MPCARFSPCAKISSNQPVVPGGIPPFALSAKSATGPLELPTSMRIFTICKHPNPCYHCLFYMMTRTSLSAATPANKGNPRPALRLKWHRHSCLCAVSMWQSLRPWLPHRIATLKHQEEAEAHITRDKFLIANPELEFKLSPIRINDLEFSNSQIFAVFHLQPDFRSAVSLAQGPPRP